MRQIGKYNGFSLVEALLAIAIFSAATAVILNSLIYVQDSNIASTNLNKASLLAQEGIEIAKGIRNEGFTLLNNGTYRINVTSGKYTLAAGTETIGNFSRQIIIDSVGLDSYNKRVTSRVVWNNRVGSQKTVENQIILSDWERTIIMTKDWSNPTVASTINLSGNDDVVDLLFEDNMLSILRANGGFQIYTWNPANSTLNLAASASVANGARKFDKYGFYYSIVSTSNTEERAVISIQDAPIVVSTENMPGNNDAIDTAMTSNRLYALRNYSGTLPGNPGPTQMYTLYIYTHNNDGNMNPAGKLLLSSRTVSRFAVYGNYVYIGSSLSTQEVAIVNATNSASPTLVGGINMTGNNSTTAMHVDGNYLFVAGNNSLIYIYSLTNPQVPALVSTVSTPANVYAIDVGMQKIFGVSRTNNRQFFVIDISTITSPVSETELAISDTFNDIAYDQTIDRAFLGSTGNSTEIRVVSP